MIDWATAGSLLAAVHRYRNVTAAELGRLVRRTPRFQNIDYPVSPLPVSVSLASCADHAIDAERYMALLERILTIYRTTAQVRDYFGLGVEEEALIDAEGEMPAAIGLARLDGYVDQADGRIRILENNSDCPAGLLFTERLNRVLDGLVAVIAPDVAARLAPMPLDAGDCARQHLLAAYREGGGTKEAPVVAVLQIPGRENVESLEMAREYSAAGTPTFVADPCTVDVGASGVSVSNRPIDIVWNKVNTVYWNQLVARDRTLLVRWRRAIEAGLTHVNAFAARYVTESKLCGAFVQEPAFAHLFEPAERALVARMLPWSTKVEPSKQVEYSGERVDLQELLHDKQVDFVLKEPYDIRGDGVTVGRSVPRSIWKERIACASRCGHVAQAFVPGRTYPVVTDVAASCVTPMTASLDSFMFHNRLVGFGSKAGLGSKVNLFQGGQKLAVRVYDP